MRQRERAMGYRRVCLGNGVVLTSKITPLRTLQRPCIRPGDTALYHWLFLFGRGLILEACVKTQIHCYKLEVNITSGLPHDIN